MKQTAVEWLANRIIELEERLRLKEINLNDFIEEKDSLIEKAKEMEKEQHDKTAEEWWKEGAHYMESGGRNKWESFEQYYNKTFKSE